jgi:predicted MFS family arabinose efflux permease
VDIVADARAAAAWLLRDRGMVVTVVTSFLGNVMAILVATATIARMQLELHVSPGVIGLVYAAGGAGMVAATLALPRIARMQPASGTLLTWLFALDALSLVALALFSLAGNIAGMALAFVVADGAAACESIMVISLRQRVAPAAMLGRVFALVRLIVLVGVTPMALAGGVLAERYGAGAILWMAAALGIVITLVARFGGLYADRR